jgi:hypothetical protein
MDQLDTRPITTIYPIVKQLDCSPITIYPVIKQLDFGFINVI